MMVKEKKRGGRTAYDAEIARLRTALEQAELETGKWHAYAVCSDMKLEALRVAFEKYGYAVAPEGLMREFRKLGWCHKCEKQRKTSGD